MSSNNQKQSEHKMQTSPRSSPRERGSRSPAYPRQDSSGTLKATISLAPGKNPSVTQTGTFYLVRDTPEQSDMSASINLLQHYGLEHSYNKYFGKKVKEELSSFLPHLPGNIDTSGIQDNRSLIEKAPITGKELITLSGSALAGFRLHPGPLPEQYQMMAQMPTKKKRHKKRSREQDSTKSSAQQLAQAPENLADTESKKPKKVKKEDESTKEKRKKKKEKKKKKQKHSPEQSAQAHGLSDLVS